MNIAENTLNTINRDLRRRLHKLLGNVSLVKPIIDNLGFGYIVEEIMENEPNHTMIENKKASEILLLNRLVAPMPMSYVEEWVDKETCVGDIYEAKEGSMNDDRIADLLDEINPHIGEIWTKLVCKAISDYKIPTEVIYNDITSIYFEGIYDESEFIKHGYSRDQKPDKKQVNLDINSNNTGVPLVYKLLEGNTSDKATVIGNMEDIMETMKQMNTNVRPLVVGDRAMLNSKIILAYHKRNDIDYLGTMQLTNDIKELIIKTDDAEYEIIDTQKDYGLYKGCIVPFEVSYEGEEVTIRLLIVKSEQKGLLDTNSRNKAIGAFTDELDDLKLKINRGKYKKFEAVEERVQILSKKYKGSKYVDINITQDTNLQIQIEYTLNKKMIDDDKVFDGKYVIATNRIDMSANQMLRTYKRRDISEKDFAILKSELKVRPIFLHKDKRIESLVFFSMCALLVYSILKSILLKKGVGMTVKRVFREFRSLSAGYYEFIDGSVLRQVSDLNSIQKVIIEMLCFPDPSSHLKTIT